MRGCRSILAAALAALVAGVPVAAATAAPATPAAATAHVRWQDHHPLPDPTATPGAAMHHAGAGKFCHAGYTSAVRHVTESTRKAVFAEYGIAWSKRSHYEVDHLIPLELGGSNAMRNLWPERGQIPNVKDGLENKLHNLVCKRKISTRHARRAIKHNWVDALHRYGHTSYVYERAGSYDPGGSGTTTHSCTRTSSGSCIQGGQFCPAADYGKTGYDAQGRAWTCTGDRSRPHWE